MIYYACSWRIIGDFVAIFFINCVQQYPSKDETIQDFNVLAVKYERILLGIVLPSIEGGDYSNFLRVLGWVMGVILYKKAFHADVGRPAKVA